MAKVTLTVIEGGAWAGVYVDGRLQHEGETIPAALLGLYLETPARKRRSALSVDYGLGPERGQAGSLPKWGEDVDFLR